MNIGDIVKHKESGDVFRILKLVETLAVLEPVPHSYKLGWYWTECNRQICRLENLVSCPEAEYIFRWIDSHKQQQLNLFQV
jgi:hypothetical protein